LAEDNEGAELEQGNTQKGKQKDTVADNTPGADQLLIDKDVGNEKVKQVIEELEEKDPEFEKEFHTTTGEQQETSLENENNELNEAQEQDGFDKFKTVEEYGEGKNENDEGEKLFKSLL